MPTTIPSSWRSLLRRMHDDSRTDMMSIMNSMYGMQRWEAKGRKGEGFKLAVLQWCGAYAVAYSLMMTIALYAHPSGSQSRDSHCPTTSRCSPRVLPSTHRSPPPACVNASAMLINRPIPAEVHPTAFDATTGRFNFEVLRDWRPFSHLGDTVACVLYYFFASAACCNALASLASLTALASLASLASLVTLLCGRSIACYR